MRLLFQKTPVPTTHHCDIFVSGLIKTLCETVHLSRPKSLHEATEVAVSFEELQSATPPKPVKQYSKHAVEAVADLDMEFRGLARPSYARLLLPSRDISTT